jgi:hypothetical protein
MSGKQMEGDNAERRKIAREAREAGQSPSEVGGSFSANKQRTKASSDMTHQEKVDLAREGKQAVTSANTPKTRPGSRDRDTTDQERFPRLKRSRGR